MTPYHLSAMLWSYCCCQSLFHWVLHPQLTIITAAAWFQEGALLFSLLFHWNMEQTFPLIYHSHLSLGCKFWTQLCWMLGMKGSKYRQKIFTNCCFLCLLSRIVGPDSWSIGSEWSFLILSNSKGHFTLSVGASSLTYSISFTRVWASSYESSEWERSCISLSPSHLSALHP